MVNSKDKLIRIICDNLENNMNTTIAKSFNNPTSIYLDITYRNMQFSTHSINECYGSQNSISDYGSFINEVNDNFLQYSSCVQAKCQTKCGKLDVKLKLGFNDSSLNSIIEFSV